ncbi:M48 family metalloprotease [Paraburkholderia bengalensis]|uniref:M48 family metalloprotease n=1 Tax=Paraburkholderia bengalensis TaxID=2747562 RepID=A0ABU8IL14_9BURK
MIRSEYKALGATLLAVVLTSCAGLPAPETLSSAMGGPQKAVMKAAGDIPPAPEHTWPDINQDLNDRRADGFGLVPMPDMERYLNGLLQKIKTVTGTTDWPGSVHITAETSLKASSSPAGNIYLSIGWLQSAESEDEIFGLLAHEYGHIYLNHYAVYDVKNAGDSSALLAGVTWSIVNRNITDHGWNGLDKIAVVQTIGSTVFIPAWQRHIEEQADLFGATVSLRCNYSYIHGFKAFLERIDTYDRQAKDRDKKLLEAQNEAIHVQIRKQTLASVAKSPPPPVVASDAAAPLQALAGINDALRQLNDALIEGQISLKEKSFDATQAIDGALVAGSAAIRDTHPEGAAREDDLSKEVASLLPAKRPAPRIKPWEAARNQPQTKLILAHYALIPQIEMLQAQRRYPEALKLAQQAASGPTLNDGMPDFYLGNLLVLARASGKPTTTQIFMRNLSSRERSWKLQLALAHLMLGENRDQAQNYLQQQFAYFGEAPATWPDVIAFYRDSGDIKRSKDMANICAIKMPSYRPSCLAMSQTPAELAEQKAKIDAHTKMVVDNASKRWFKQ